MPTPRRGAGGATGEGGGRTARMPIYSRGRRRRRRRAAARLSAGQRPRTQGDRTRHLGGRAVEGGSGAGGGDRRRRRPRARPTSSLRREVQEVVVRRRARSACGGEDTALMRSRGRGAARAEHASAATPPYSASASRHRPTSRRGLLEVAQASGELRSAPLRLRRGHGMRRAWSRAQAAHVVMSRVAVVLGFPGSTDASTSSNRLAFSDARCPSG